MGSRKKPKTSRGIAPGLFLVGSGLLILGIVSAFWLSSKPVNTVGASEMTAIPAAVNFPAPELTLMDLDRNPTDLDDFHGKVVLINNWATWCPPCKAEMPTLQAYYEKHQDQDFILLAVDAGDPESDVRQFVQDYGLTFQVWLDPENLSLSAFRNDSLPSSYVVTRDGVVRLAWTGPINMEVLEKYVSPLLED